MLRQSTRIHRTPEIDGITRKAMNNKLLKSNVIIIIIINTIF